MTASQSRRGKAEKPQKTDMRALILKAARKVFAEHPYNAASIRMIGKAAGIDHPLVSYYFPTKSRLFQEVLKDIAEENYQETQKSFRGMDKMNPDKGFARYLDRLLAYNRLHPYAFRVLLLNMVQAEHESVIPGYSIIQDISRRTARIFKTTVPLNAPESRIERFTTSFNLMIINYLGAQRYYGEILDIAPGSREYEQWVKETLIYLFLPHLKTLIQGAQEDFPKPTR